MEIAPDRVSADALTQSHNGYFLLWFHPRRASPTPTRAEVPAIQQSHRALVVRCVYRDKTTASPKSLNVVNLAQYFTGERIV